MMNLNILLIVSLLTITIAKHIHQKQEVKADPVPLVYVAAVQSGFPIKSSADLNRQCCSADLAAFNKKCQFYEDDIQIYNLVDGTGWSAPDLDTNHWLQVSFFGIKNVEAIATRGKSNPIEYQGYVTSYMIQYTIDGITWLNYD